jgi:hypothetical protein
MARLTPEREDELFRALADQLYARATGDTCEHCGRSAASPQELTVLRQFLSDNGITAALPAAGEIHRLVRNLPFSDGEQPKKMNASKAS